MPVSRISPHRHWRRWLLLTALLFLVEVLPWLSHRWVTDESWYAGPGVTLSQGHGLTDPALAPMIWSTRWTCGRQEPLW